MVCQPPCSWMDVKLGWPDRSDYTRRDASYLRMYFTTRVKAKNTAEDYPISSLVSDIGGYVGLMVGRKKIDTGTRNHFILVLAKSSRQQKVQHDCQPNPACRRAIGRHFIKYFVHFICRNFIAARRGRRRHRLRSEENALQLSPFAGAGRLQVK